MRARWQLTGFIAQQAPTLFIPTPTPPLMARHGDAQYAPAEAGGWDGGMHLSCSRPKGARGLISRSLDAGEGDFGVGRGGESLAPIPCYSALQTACTRGCYGAGRESHLGTKTLPRCSTGGMDAGRCWFLSCLNWEYLSWGMQLVPGPSPSSTRQRLVQLLAAPYSPALNICIILKKIAIRSPRACDSGPGP